ncbi:MAG: fimbrillin family protein [Alistipes sp.]|nr:fimbrillin family protein [Alistipes sp.]
MHASQGVETRADEQNILFIEDEAINVGQTEGVTRSQVDEVGDGAENSIQPVRWSDDDKFLAWAAPVGTGGESSTNYADGFNAVTFSLDHYNSTFSSADFAATLSKPMAVQNQFDYYATYPVPSSVSGTQVSFNIPSVQSGDFDGACDIMRASVRGNALVERAPTQVSTPVWPEPMLSFEHIMHVLRIYVPANRNLMVNNISRLDITFPDNVVGGTVSFDAARPDVAPTWSGQTNKVTIQMDSNPLNANGRYVWVFIKPSVMSGEVKFRAYNLQGEPSQMISTTLSNHNFQAQHITPFTLTIPKALAPVTITFTCPDDTSYPNFLGEAPNAMYVKEWPAGIVALGENDNVIKTLDGTFVAKFYYEAGELNTELPGKTMRVGFTSQSADVSHNEVTMTIPSTLSTGGNYTLNFALPYLFYEDFKDVGATSSNDEYKTSSTGNKDGVSINGLNGWTGARVGSSANVSVRLAARYESVLGGATYPSRIDSAPLSRLQVESTVAVFYNYGMDAQYGGIGGSVKTMYCYTGYVTSNDVFGGGDGDGTFTDEYEMKEQGASYTSMPYSRIAVLNNIPASVTRITWRTKTEKPGGASNCTCWLYIDNVKVSIGTSTKHTNLNYRTFFPNHQN